MTHLCVLGNVAILSCLACCALAVAQAAPVRREPEAPVVLLQDTPVGIVMMPDGSYTFYNLRDAEKEIVLLTPDGKRVKPEPAVGFKLPQRSGNGSPLLLGPDGELHYVWPQARGTGRRYAVDRFIDLWHRKTSSRMARWEAPKMIWEGYTGALMEYRQLSSGRIVAPFGAWIAHRPMAPPTGSHVVTAVYSDDQGRTWKQSRSQLTSPCYEGYNGSNYGACEPSIIELRDGRVYMLMRTQAGFLYESWSRDAAEWSEAVPSRFYSSSSPPGLLRLRDGRVALFWNNCQKPPRVEREGVYSGRDALHAAISDDEGRTWRGFREVYRDIYRNETPPKRGDRGTAYPFGTYGKDGAILLMSGQGRGRRNFVRIDPDWLTLTHHEDDFSRGLDGWHVFKSFGPATGWWRDRTVGPALVAHPSTPGAKALHVRRRDEEDPDGATWNFPLGWEGKLTVRLMLRPGFGGGSIALVDRLFDPCDGNGERLAMFVLPIPPDGRIGDGHKLAVGQWQAIELSWDLAAGQCTTAADGAYALTLRQAHETGNGISYLRLRSSAREIDRAGFLVESVRVQIGDGVAPPRTAEQNRSVQAEYVRLLKGFRNEAAAR